jgi:Ni,Fe-hydrogenase III large subunit
VSRTGRGELAVLPSGARASFASLPWLPFERFREALLVDLAGGSRMGALFGYRDSPDRTKLVAVLLHGGSGEIRIGTSDVGRAYRALTPECPQLHVFEREMAELLGCEPLGHPRLAPVRLRTADDPEWQPIAMDGRSVHEVAVGPVHAGVIEPGHFRFQCHGERVFRLDIALGYQHRGVERALVGGPTRRTMPIIETLAGDTTAGHALAYARVVEALAGCRPTERAEALRAVALELERMANHVGDLGALAGDVGYLPGAAFCGRLRGEFLNLTALACGSRLGRGWIRPGGVARDLSPELVARMLEALTPALRDFHGVRDLLRATSTVRARFEETGTLTREACVERGIVGLAARAAGLGRDARTEFPSGAYRAWPIPIASWTTGDVFARARVRSLEVDHSAAYVEERLRALPADGTASPVGPLAPESVAVAVVEGWRGEICHVALTDEAGRFRVYKIVDPSFHNWRGLEAAMRDQSISDFPLCNKSFNLSYCGFDL